MITLTISEAKNIALYYQLYRFAGSKGKAGILHCIQALGYVQLDTVSVIERAHHHTLWNRVRDYQQQWLDELLSKDRAIFEYWGHAASYLPMTDYRYSLPRKKHFPETASWEKKFWSEHNELASKILDRITTDGPLSTKDFQDSRQDHKNKSWWDWKPAKITLELLMWKGDLMVTARHNFQRVYDLTERVLPQQTDTTYPTPDELGRYYVNRAIQSQGISSQYDILNHMHTREKKTILKALESMLSNGELVEVRIANSVLAYYTTPEAIDIASTIKHPATLYLLSPFDNVTILRPRLQQLFSFDYTIECYVPAPKRLYGYWSLPMLYKGNLVGRIDLKAERKANSLLVQNLHWEKRSKPTASLLKTLEKALLEFAAFNNCQHIVWNCTPPQGM